MVGGVLLVGCLVGILVSSFYVETSALTWGNPVTTVLSVTSICVTAVAPEG
jgi:hypothetical protein